MRPVTYNSKDVFKRALTNENRETIDWILYDSVLMAASVTQTLTLFQNIIGSVGRTRTNMKTQGMLTPPQGFICTELSCRLINPSGAQFSASVGAGGTTGDVVINQIFSKMYWEMRLEPSIDYEGFGYEFFDQINVVTDNSTPSNTVQLLSDGLLWKTKKFKNPIVIPPARNFSLNVTLTTPAAAGGYTAASTLLYFYMKGFLYRNK